MRTSLHAVLTGSAGGWRELAKRSCWDQIEWERRCFAGEQLMGMDRPVTRNAVLIFRAQGTKKYFAMNLNLRAVKNSIFLKTCWPLLRPCHWWDALSLSSFTFELCGCVLAFLTTTGCSLPLLGQGSHMALVLMCQQQNQHTRQEHPPAMLEMWALDTVLHQPGTGC